MTAELAILLILVFFAATVVATVAGFGNALVGMPLLIPLVGVRTAAPMMACVGVVTWTVLAVRNRQEISGAVVWRLIGASLLFVPVGILLVSKGPEVWLRTALGVVAIGYVLYRWTGYEAPRLTAGRWTAGFGAMGGVLSGAFNTAGPVVVIYGDTQRWPPDRFRANLAAYFISNLVVTAAGHVVAGNVTADVLQGAAVAVPAVAVGLVVGAWFARRIDPLAFRRVALGLLLVLGIRLSLSWLF